MARSSIDRRGVLGALGLRLVGLAGLCAIGCDSMSFTPPRPPELSNPAATAPAKIAAAAAEGMRSIDVILAPRGNEDIEYLKTAARVQAGLDKVRTRIVEVPGAGPELSDWRARAEAVGELAAENPVAIVIEAPATPAPDLSKAAAEARAQGVLIVALGRSLDDAAEQGEESEEKENAEAKSESASVAREIVVAPEPFGWSAEILVADAIRNAKNGELDPQSGALLFINSTSDPLAQDRADALRVALRSKGIEAIEELRFAGPDGGGREKLLEHLKAHPKTALVFATDFISLNIADKLTEELKDAHPYVIAGYSADETHGRNQTLTGQYAAVGIYSADRLLRKGINAAAAAAERGVDVPDRVEVRVVMHESRADSALPKAALREEGAEPNPDPGQAKTKTKIELKD